MKKWLKSVFALAIGAISLVWSGLAQAVEIEYWQYTYGSRVEAIDNLIESFEAANPGITVKPVSYTHLTLPTKA